MYDSREDFLKSIRARENEYRTFKKVYEEQLESAKNTAGIGSPEYSRCWDNLHNLKINASVPELKAARAAFAAEEKGVEGVLVEDFNDIWTYEVKEFCDALRLFGCRRIVITNDGSGTIKTLAEFAKCKWNVTGVTEVNGDPAVVLEFLS